MITQMASGISQWFGRAVDSFCPPQRSLPYEMDPFYFKNGKVVFPEDLPYKDRYDTAFHWANLESVQPKKNKTWNDAGFEYLGEGSLVKVFGHQDTPHIAYKFLFKSGVRLLNPKSKLDYLRQVIQVSDQLFSMGVGPNVYGYTVRDGEVIVMQERIYGQTLDDIIASRPLGNNRKALLKVMLQQIASHYVLVLDLKPENIMYGHTLANPENRFYIVDSERIVSIDNNEMSASDIYQLQISEPFAVSADLYVEGIGVVYHLDNLKRIMQ